MQCFNFSSFVLALCSSQGELLCYQRSGTEAIPGCSGVGTSGKDYCAERPTEDTLFLRKNNGNLGACDGNCNSDTDCDGMLFCASPNIDGEVPGCDGLGVSNVQYCRQPSLVQLGAHGSPVEAFPLGVCEGGCDNDGDCQV